MNYDHAIDGVPVPLAKPTTINQQIGHDVLKLLAGFSYCDTGDRGTYFRALVQTGSKGVILPRFDPHRVAYNPHKRAHGTYGAFAGDTLYDRADANAARITDLTPARKLEVLNEMVAHATKNPLYHWQLSCTAMRRLVYPHSFILGTDRRCDRLFYEPCRTPRTMNGGYIVPASLDRADVLAWQERVSKFAPTYDVERFGPVIA